MIIQNSSLLLYLFLLWQLLCSHYHFFFHFVSSERWNEKDDPLFLEISLPIMTMWNNSIAIWLNNVIHYQSVVMSWKFSSTQLHEFVGINYHCCCQYAARVNCTSLHPYSARIRVDLGWSCTELDPGISSLFILVFAASSC